MTNNDISDIELEILKKKAEILDIIREQEILSAKINELQEKKMRLVAELQRLESEHA